MWIGATVHGIGSGTDRNAVWLLAIYSVAAAVVAGAIVWRFARMRPLAVGAALVTGAAIVGLAAGPLHVQSRPWNAVTFSGPMQGASDRLADTTLRFNTFMLTGVGGARQQVWFRADVLIRLPGTVRSSSFQMAYLPSGLRRRALAAVGDTRAAGWNDLCPAPEMRRYLCHICAIKVAWRA